MTKQYDLEELTEVFAKDIRNFVKRLPKDLANMEYSRQLIRASGSVGANSIEANEALLLDISENLLSLLLIQFPRSILIPRCTAFRKFQIQTTR